METRFCAWVWPSEPMPIPICRLPSGPDDAIDVVIAVSHSGATKELLQSVQTAKAAGAGIIVITSHGQSLLAKLADNLCGMGREVSTCRKPVPRG